MLRNRKTKWLTEERLQELEAYIKHIDETIGLSSATMEEFIAAVERNRIELGKEK